MANSWVGFMMGPTGVTERGDFIGTTWQAFDNHLSTPIAIHRMLGNLAFGGLIAGAYAAVKFIGSRTDEDRAHYDWMGYISNFVAIAGLIPLPFAGYYLGREVYSTSAVMGNNMMGGDFSWTLIILSTFFSFLLYRRGNKGERVPISKQGNTAKITIIIGGLAAIAIIGQYAIYLLTADPKVLDLPPDRAVYFRTVGWLLTIQCGVAITAVILALKDKGIFAQGLYLGTTAASVALFLGVHGFIVMEKASPFLRNVAVSKFMQLIACIVLR